MDAPKFRIWENENPNRVLTIQPKIKNKIEKRRMEVKEKRIERDRAREREEGQGR
ncbi:hypothetical protein SLEP1_g17441 [Rubroshorea leprosula]|uniref:Uncharacterized protein n=1 Tax=Rubroshorea leprosula TaxID=152421 RepID=A0AAV5J056_9ROSI|nr:hypothetical protein SLEP1_g17441 [Rubroshorea leprosula]